MTADSDTTLRVGVVGFGKMGLLHGAIVNGLPGSRLAAVADNTPGLVNMLERVLPGVARYDDFDSMLAHESLDAIFITSPTYLHARMALASAEAGVPFLVEKPLAVRSDECEGLVRVLARSDLTTAVGYMARHLDTFRTARAILSAGALGRPIHLQCSMYVAQLFVPGKGWRYDPALSGGGVLLTQNSHLIDLLLWLFGPITRVTGHVKSWYSKTVDDFAHAYLEFSSGLSGYMDCSWSVRHHRTVDLAIRVHGENGTLTITDDQVELFLEAPAGSYTSGWTVLRKPDLFQGVTPSISRSGHPTGRRVSDSGPAFRARRVRRSECSDCPVRRRGLTASRLARTGRSRSPEEPDAN
jgi:predicted dehydrogenase